MMYTKKISKQQGCFDSQESIEKETSYFSSCAKFDYFQFTQIFFAVQTFELVDTPLARSPEKDALQLFPPNFS